MARRETVIAQAGLHTDTATGAISNPIYLSATFSHPELGKSTGYDYTRSGNPTRKVLEDAIAQLENGHAGFAFSSGMAAITTVLTLFSKGDHIIACDDLYGGTYRLFETVFARLGISVSYVDCTDLPSISAAVKPATKAIFIETPSNPMMKIADLNLIGKLAKERQLLFIVDNTFMTPYFQCPILYGADVVVHSATKYLGGHHDSVAGLVVTANEALSKRIWHIQNSVGAVLSPFDSWLILRGIKTLALRMAACHDSATKIAQWLHQQPMVEQVYFPGMGAEKANKIHHSQASGSGGVISFSVKSRDLVEQVIRSVKLFSFAESLGGVESLITFPLVQTHADIPAPMLKSLGITDTLIRLSVGIEHVDDLIADLDAALRRT